MYTTKRYLPLVCFFLFACSLMAQFPASSPFEKWENHFKKNYFDLGYSRANMGGTGYYPYLRERRDYDLNVRQDGTMPDRWGEFQKARLRSLNSQKTAMTPNWVSQGPNSIDTLTGRLVCHAFHPGRPDTIYAGSTGGGLWRTTNAGGNWEVLADNLPSLRVSAIAFETGNPDHMLIGTGMHMGTSITLNVGVGVLESFDGGNTWNSNSFAYQLGAGVSVEKILWHKDDPARVCLAASNGVWVSTDTGATWTQKLFICANALVASHREPNTIYTTQRLGDIQKSTDFGQTWFPVTAGLPGQPVMFRTRLAICDSFPDYLIAGIVEPTNFSLQGVYRSRDGGDTWAQMTGVPLYPCQPNLPTSCQGWYNNTVAISPADTNVMFLGGVGFWRTDDGGATWTQHDYLSNGFGGTNAGLVYVDHFDLGFHPEDPETIYSFNDGGVQRSTDNGLWWERLSDDLVTALIYSTASSHQDTLTMVGGFQDHGVQWVDRAGGNQFWHRLTNNDGVQVAIDPTDDNVWYSCVLFGQNYKHVRVFGNVSSFLINAGITTTTTTAFHEALTHDPVNSRTLYTSTDTDVYKTINGGTNWVSIAQLPWVRQIAVSPVNPDYVYLAAYDNSTWQWYYSTDGGQNFTISLNSPGWRVTAIAPDPVHAGTVYATRNSAFANNPHVYKSINNGNTWTPVSVGLPDVGTYDIVVNPFNPDHVYIATDLGVYMSDDAGLSWMDFNGNIPAYQVNDIDFSKPDSTLRIATIGRGVWKARPEFTPITGLNAPAGSTSPTLQLSPNPAYESVDIRFDLPNEGVARLEMWNALGQRVRVVTHSSYAAGSFSETITAPEAGVYYIRLIHNGKRLTRKLIVL